MVDDGEYTSINDLFEDNGDPDFDPASVSSKSSFKSKKLNLPDENLKKDVARLLSQSSKRLTFLPKIINERKTKSAVWNTFNEALIDDKRTSIFKCNECTALYIYKMETGTSSMIRHSCSAKPKTSNKKTASIPKPISNVFRKAVPQESIDQHNRDITIGLAKDLEALNHVDAEGFLYIAQTLINFGAKYGQQSVKDMIKHRTTLKRTHLPEICDRLENDVKLSLEKAPTYPNLAFTTDMWSEKYNSKSFLSLSAHYINEDWKLISNMLGLAHFEKRKTTDNVRSECERILGNYFREEQVDSIIKNSTAVTDSGSNVVKVFSNRQPCQCHKINTCNEWTFNERPVPSAEKIAEKASKGKPIAPKKLFNLGVECPTIKETICGVKELVTYFKHSKLNSQLSITLKQEVPTRFNSLYFPLMSYSQSADEVNALLCKMDKLNYLMNIDDNIVKELIQYLLPFKECCDTLSGDKYPTINRVALCYHELEEHIQIKASDSDEIQKLKMIMSSNLMIMSSNLMIISPNWMKKSSTC